MKRFMLILALVLATSFVVTAQYSTQEKVWESYHTDTLATAPDDTVDITWNSNRSLWDGYQITVRSSAADTIVVETSDAAGNWAIAGVISQQDANGAVATQIITTTSNVKWTIVDPAPYAIRVRANAVLGTQSTFFTVQGILKD